MTCSGGNRGKREGRREGKNTPRERDDGDDVHLMLSHVSGVPSLSCGVKRAPEQNGETEKRAEARSRCIIVSSQSSIEKSAR